MQSRRHQQEVQEEQQDVRESMSKFLLKAGANAHLRSEKQRIALETLILLRRICNTQDTPCHFFLSLTKHFCI